MDVDTVSDASAETAKPVPVALLSFNVHAVFAFVITSYSIHYTKLYDKKIAALALEVHVPTVSGLSESVDAGGLMSYGPHYGDLYQRAGRLVHAILKGIKPANLPVEQPVRFELVIVITSYSIHYTKLYELYSSTASTYVRCIWGGILTAPCR